MKPFKAANRPDSCRLQETLYMSAKETGSSTDRRFQGARLLNTLPLHITMSRNFKTEIKHMDIKNNNTKGEKNSHMSVITE